jgi:poly[(R)-3-hydroxyalkanoate] polymerase subunit PhaC
MTDSPDPLDRVSRELQRVQVRARNGLRHIAGVKTGTVAATPKSVVWRRDEVVLYRYDAGVQVGRTPILLVMSLVTKPYVFDLRPGSSLVEDLLGAGHDVFLLDWGAPKPVDAHNGLETYTDQYLPRAVEAVRRAAESTDVTLIAYCLGALLALLSVAGNPQMPVRNLVVLATPVKMRDLSPMTTMIAEERLRPEDLVDETGNVPASVVKEGLRIVKPTLPLTTYSNLWQSLANDEALSAHNALVGWSGDHIDFPGKAFRQLATHYIRDGAPLDGTAPVGDRIVNLSDVRCPVLSVTGANDFMVPVEASEPLAELLPNADFETLVLPAGHAGIFVGRQARTRCVPSIIQWLAEHS